VQQFAPHAGVEAGDGWATTSELAGPGLETALALCGAALRTDRRDIQGQRLVEAVTWRLAVPHAVALVTGIEAPDLSAANALVWIGDDPPGGNGVAMRAASTRDLADLETTNAFLAAEHLAPLVAAVNAATRRPAEALWRAVDDRLAAAVTWIAQMTGANARAFELLDGKAELRLLDLGTYELLLHVRKGCCLYYRTPIAVKCFSCPLLDDDGRRRLVAGGG
jgi:hypothetical protein